MSVGELSRRTGLSTAAINFYVREGVLPRPPKTSATRAVFDESYIDRIERIAELKARGLTLKVIARVLNNPDPASELGITRPRARQQPVGLDGFVDQTELSREQVANAIELGLLEPSRTGRDDRALRFDARDISVGRALARLLDLGIGFDLLARHAAEFEPLTRAETHYLAEHIAATRRNDHSRRAALETSASFARVRDYLRARRLAREYPDWLDGA